MVLRTLASKNYGEKLPVIVKCHNLYSFKEGVTDFLMLEYRYVRSLYSSFKGVISVTMLYHIDDVLL